tara:strand:- start:3020 stop:3817 length:798 start_codon:yes stop_codon:yes gene_type:complete
MSKNVYIYHHLGLGDHFHCNGVVRFIIKNKYQNKSYKLFSKNKYYEMVKFMYRDLHNLEIIGISDDEKKEKEEVNSYLKKDDILETIGFDYFLKNKNKNKTIDMIFYQQFNIDYSKRFELTYWKRDIDKENSLFKSLVNQNEEYIFVHDDNSRGFTIPKYFLKEKYPIIRNSYKHSIFDYCKIIENAKEIHVMESSVRCMLEYLNTSNSKHYLYDFTGGPWKSIPFYLDNEIVGSSKKWEIKKIDFDRANNFFSKLKKLIIKNKN